MVRACCVVRAWCGAWCVQCVVRALCVRGGWCVRAWCVVRGRCVRGAVVVLAWCGAVVVA